MSPGVVNSGNDCRRKCALAEIELLALLSSTKSYRCANALRLWTSDIFVRWLRPATLQRSMLFRSNYSPARRWSRQWWNRSVDVFADATHVKAIATNISVGGMGLFAVANLHVGSRIEVEFQAPQSGKTHRLSGVVRHRALYLYGIEFVREHSSCLDPIVPARELD